MVGMLLTIDIGNTNICLGLFKENQIANRWRIHSDNNKTSDEYFAFLYNLFQNQNISPQVINDAIIASVNPKLTFKLIDAIRNLIQSEPKVVDVSHDYGMKICVDNPLEVGTDRIVNAISGYHYYKTGLIIIDFGTATTFDIISEQAEYLGGVISIGLQLSLNALVENTAKLPQFDLQIPNKIIGKNTIACMQSGIIEGYASMIDGLVEKIEQELHFKPTIIATGGLARMMHKVCKKIEKIHDNLTLEGLFLIHNMLK